MKSNKILKIASLVLLTSTLAACGKEKVSEKEYKEWAEKNGYVLASDYDIDADNDIATAATASGVGGLNYGDVDWTNDLMKEALKVYLSGDNKNYREMYSIATSYNNVPGIANVEYVLDTETFELFGGSEKNTQKLNQMLVNPKVSLYWTRQLRETDVTKSYFQSYGVQIEGTVKFYDYEALTGTEKTKFLSTARNYFKTMGVAYGKFYDTTNADYLSDEALIQYFVSAGTTYYSIVPSKIVITSPYLLFTTYNAEGDNFLIAGHANEFLDNTFLKSLLNHVRTVKEDNTITALNGVMAGKPGLKTQTILTFGN